MKAKVLPMKVKYSPEMKKEARKRSDIDYKSNKWVFHDEHRNRFYTVHFKDSLGPYIDSAKVWCLMRIDAGVAYGTASADIYSLAGIMERTDCFKNLKLELILGPKKGDVSSKNATVFCLYSKFIGVNEEKIKEVSSYIGNKKGAMRELASVSSFIKLDYLISDFYSNSYFNKDRVLYFPIIIWWKVGTIIPNRPEEFCMIRKDCLRARCSGYYLEVATAKNMMQREPEYEWMPISAEIYNLISEYLRMTGSADRKNLFSLVDYEKKYKENNQALVTEYNTDILTSLLKDFYSEICEKKMGKVIIPKGNSVDDDDFIEYISLGDLRPYAIYNMMAQGMDPYAIKRLARHKNMSSQTAYYPNMQNMALGRVHAMARRIRMRTPNAIFLNLSGMIDERKILAKQLMNFGEGIKVKNGTCFNNLHCSPGMDCLACIHYLPNDPEEIRHAYEKEIKALEDCVNAIIAIYKARNGRYDRLESLSKEMNTRINRAALLEARNGQTK